MYVYRCVYISECKNERERDRKRDREREREREIEKERESESEREKLCGCICVCVYAYACSFVNVFLIFNGVRYGSAASCRNLQNFKVSSWKNGQ